MVEQRRHDGYRDYTPVALPGESGARPYSILRSDCTATHGRHRFHPASYLQAARKTTTAGGTRMWRAPKRHPQACDLANRSLARDADTVHSMDEGGAGISKSQGRGPDREQEATTQGESNQTKVTKTIDRLANQRGMHGNHRRTCSWPLQRPTAHRFRARAAASR